MNAVLEDTCLKCGADLDNWDNNPFRRHCDTCEANCVGCSLGYSWQMCGYHTEQKEKEKESK